MQHDPEERQLVARLLAEVGDRAPIDPERERDLAREIQAGLDAQERLGESTPPGERAHLEEAIRAGRDAKHELVTAHLPLVVGMAKRYRWAPISFLELIQEGALGLLRAAERFDWRLGTPFAAYAAWWVRHAMSRAVRQATGSVRFTAERRDQLRRLAQARAADPAAGPAALGVAAGIGEEDATTLVPFLGAPIPLDAETDRGRALEELLADRRAEEEMEEVLVSAEVMHLLNVADRVLTPRQREVLEDRYGLGGRTPKTLREVAERLGVSVQRVYQIERSALDRLRAELARPD